MIKRLGMFAGICALALTGVWPATAAAQSDVKEKPALYSYVGNWSIPRAQWGDMEKANASDQKILEKALASGTIVGYGNDVTLIHTAEGSTHDDWWSATSMAGLMTVLEQFYAAGTTTSPVLSSATKHWDSMWVSHYYNWHPGTFKNVYSHVGYYKLKADAADDAVESLSKNMIVPLMEKLLADGTIHEYEVDEQAIHTQAPGSFIIVYIAANGEALDKVNAAVRDMMKASPLGGSAFGSMTDSTAHRDDLTRTTATYK